MSVNVFRSGSHVSSDEEEKEEDEESGHDDDDEDVDDINHETLPKDVVRGNSPGQRGQKTDAHMFVSSFSGEMSI